MNWNLKGEELVMGTRAGKTFLAKRTTGAKALGWVHEVEGGKEGMSQRR